MPVSTYTLYLSHGWKSFPPSSDKPHTYTLHNILARGSDFRQGVLMAMPTKTGPGAGAAVGRSGARFKLYYSLAAISRLLISLYLFASSSNAAV